MSEPDPDTARDWERCDGLGGGEHLRWLYEAHERDHPGTPPPKAAPLPPLEDPAPDTQRELEDPEEWTLQSAWRTSRPRRPERDPADLVVDEDPTTRGTRRW